MIEGFIFVCYIVAAIYLFNLVSVIVHLFQKKEHSCSKARINPYKFFVRLFRNMDDGFGTDVKIAILPIICTIMTMIGIGSIIKNALYWILQI